MESKEPVFVYIYCLCQVLYISVHRCHCWLVCLTFCVVFSFLFSDVELYKDGLLCTRIFHRCRK